MSNVLQQYRKQLLIVLAVLVGLVAFGVSGQSTAALGSKYFDDDPTGGCDVSDCTGSGPTRIELVVGQTTSVRLSSVVLYAYYDGPNGSMRINNYNFCPGWGGGNDGFQSGNYFGPGGAGFGTLPIGTATTDIYVDVANNKNGPDPGSLKAQGRYYNDASRCAGAGAHLNITFGAGGYPALKYDAKTGLYFARITAYHADDGLPTRDCGGIGSTAPPSDCEGIQNTFDMIQTSPATNFAITQQGIGNGATGYDVTAQKRSGSAQYADYTIRFGADCTVTGATTAYLGYYDLDNWFGGAPAGGGAQTGRTITMELRDVTLGLPGFLIKTWTPGSGDNIKQQEGFTAQPDHDYHWIIKDVYFDNTIQFSTPYDGIFYFKDCLPTGSVPTVLNCSQLSGIVYDPSNTATAVMIRVYLDKPNTAPGPHVMLERFADEPGSAPGIPGSHTFNIDLDDPSNIFYDELRGYSGSHRFYIYARDVRSNGTSTNKWVPMEGSDPTGSITCPPALPACGPTGLHYTISPTNPPSPNEPFDLRVTLRHNATPGPSRPTYKLGYSLSGTPPSSNSDLVYASTSPTITTSPVVGLIRPAGRYTLTLTFTGPGVSRTCTPVIDISDKPYFKVYGGDIQAGAGFRDASTGVCSPAVTGNMYGFRKNGTFAGAGTQVAAFALGAIDEFISDDRRATSLGSARHLTFANTPASTYGGNFGATGMPCIEDYWALSALGTVLPDGTPTGGRVVGASSPLKQTIFIDGNTRITGNITYNLAGWTSVNTIPSFRLIVRGDIYIDPSVNQLDGLYFATGRIYTCAPPVITPSSLESACRNRLVINGAFIANQVKFLRLANTVGNATPGELSATSPAAEVFNFTPDVWLAQPSLMFPPSTDYDAITSLPPVL